MQINMKSNISAVSKAIDAFGRNQMPFATSQALNTTAFDVRSQIVNKTYPRSFTVRNKRFAGTMFRVSKSTKRKLTAVIFDRLGKDFMTMQAEGGVKKPRGQHLAIPSNSNKVTRTASGAIRKAQRPRQLLSRNKVFVNKLIKSGDEAIMRRVGKDRYPVEMLYLLTPQGKIKKRFPFYEDGQMIANKKFAQNFAKAFKQAKRTARRR